MTPHQIKFTRSNQSDLLDAALFLTNSTGWHPDAHAVGAVDGDRILAVVVFQKITTMGAEVHFGGEPNWARRSILESFFRYAFDAKKYPSLVFPIAWDNARAQVTALKSGALVSGLVGAGVMMEKDAITMTMTRNMCRWLPPSETENRAVQSDPAP